MRSDQLREIALVAQARRPVLLRVHRHRLRKEDLEDCFSQATLELLAQARAGEAGGRGGVGGAGRGGGGGEAGGRGGGGGGGARLTRAHLANVLEQRFVSRIQDRRRALRGRSPAQATLDSALPLGDGSEGIEVEDVRAELERLVLLRLDLRNLGRVIHHLTEDQRLILTSLVDSELDCVQFCGQFGWSKEKYRKVSQRARARLRELLEGSEESFFTSPVPSGAGGRRER
jgi:DNA-directed RNA polymerase specialized sigma24 family protein